MKFTRSALASVLLVLLFVASACKQPPVPPRPTDTSLPGGGSGRNSSQFVSPETIRRAPLGDDLPALRNSDFGDVSANGGRLEDILPSIYFDFDQSAVRPTDRPALQEAADYLLRNPSHKLLIEGHCDWRGTAQYNLALGERRAASARDYLLSLGIDPTRVEIVSQGDIDAVEVDDEVQLQQDRRADLVVIP